MDADVYSIIEEQYQSLVRDVEKCQETINQLSTRIDQQSVRISELENKINMLKLGFPVF